MNQQCAYYVKNKRCRAPSAGALPGGQGFCLVHLPVRQGVIPVQRVLVQPKARQKAKA